MNVSIKQLRAFVSAAGHASFSQGAAEMAVTQSGFSLIIRELELQLGVRLFDRTTRRVVLTNAGSEFLPRAQRVLSDLDSACQEVRDLREKRRGRVSIAVLPSVAASIMPRMLKAFSAKYPAVNVHLKESHADQLFEQVCQGDVDIGVGVKFEQHENLSISILQKDPLMVLLPSGDPLAKRKEVPWSALANGKYIAINRSRSSVHHLASKALGENGHTAEPSFEVGSMTSAVAFVQCGMGFTIVPKIALTMLRVERLEARRLRTPVVNRDIAMLWFNKRSLSPAAMALKDELANYCKSQ